MSRIRRIPATLERSSSVVRRGNIKQEPRQSFDTFFNSQYFHSANLSSKSRSMLHGFEAVYPEYTFFLVVQLWVVFRSSDRLSTNQRVKHS